MKYLFLGIVQGLTEFLPVSSQGHLMLAYRWLGLAENIAFDTVLHLATALAAALYFRREIIQLFASRRRLLWLMVVATFFTGVLGLVFKDWFESLFSNFFYVGPFFIATGLVILLGEWLGKGNKTEAKMGVKEASVIGLAQGLAIIPSLSRSAMTISAALACGLERSLAARFSFIIAIPAILGAGLIQSKAIIKTGTMGIGLAPLAIGFMASFLAGLLAIRFFMAIIEKTSIRIFAYYCLALGLIVIFTIGRF
ncbi:MAG: undecaprenyl-diphosphate phosphatase [Candidatus Margulisbacteria bacterium]|nr:undecaprenyl-diphosphate phosphatase [Candidatus Margulisiibacteriota bacterium]